MTTRCEYRSANWKPCSRRASHIHESVKSTTGEGTMTRYERRCSEHSEAADKDIHAWTTERMLAAQKRILK